MYKRTEVFAKIAKMSLGEFQKLMGEDMNEAFIRVLEGMGKSGQGMQSIVNALNSMKLDGQRSVQVLGVLRPIPTSCVGSRKSPIMHSKPAHLSSKSSTPKTKVPRPNTKSKKKALHEQAVLLGETLNPGIHLDNLDHRNLSEGADGSCEILIPDKRSDYPNRCGRRSLQNHNVCCTQGDGDLPSSSYCVYRHYEAGNAGNTGIQQRRQGGPWGWIATAISVAIGAVTLFSDKIFKTHEQVRNMAAEAAVEI